MFHGFGITRIDGVELALTFQAWGAPDLPLPVQEWRFSDILADPRYRDRFLEWAGERLINPEFIRWAVLRWLARIWDPAVASSDNKETAYINAIIRHYDPKLGRVLARLDSEGQIDGLNGAAFRKDSPNPARLAGQNIPQAHRIAILELTFSSDGGT